MIPGFLKRLLLGLGLAAVALGAPALQGPPSAWGVPSFKSYGGDQGLTTLSVNTLAQDQAGFIWVGTEDGLFRYDGESFHRFDAKDGLADGYVDAIASAPDGTVWVVTRKGLAHSKGGGFETVPAAAGLPKAEELSPFASLMACDAQSRLWIATRQGLYQGGPSGFWPVDGLPRDPFAGVWISPWDGTVLATAGKGRLFRRQAGGAWEQIHLPPPYDKRYAVSILADREGRAWVRGDGFLLRFERDWSLPAKDLSKLMPLKTIRDATLSIDAQGRVWVPTQSGLGCVQGDSAYLLDESKGLPDNWASCAMVDREGSLWVGSEGVHRVLGRMLWTAATRRQGLPSDTVWSIARTEDGRTWAGTQGGLAVSGDSGWKAVPETKGQPVVSLALDGAGGLWANGDPSPRTKTSLWHFLPGGHGVRVPLPGAAAESIQALARGEDGTIWAVSQSGSLWKVPHGKEPETVPAKALGRSAPFALLVGEGAVFISSDRGLAVLDQGAWRLLGPQDGLLSANTQAMAMTPSGDLWLSYGDTHGLSVLKRKDGHWAVATREVAVPALVEDGIVSMGFDATGRLWLGTSRGVKCWDGQAVRRFGRGEGLPGEDADGGALLIGHEGVWFGMSNGLAHLDTRNGVEPAAPPEARVLGMKDGGGHSLPADGLAEIRFPYRSMDFDYAALSYVNEGRVRLQIRLQGFEDQWRDTKFRAARYTALPPGLYRFEVRAALGEGAFGNPDTADFRILAPWWSAWWFYGLCFALVAALVLALLRWRTAVLEHRNRDLEALIKARTLDLQRANERLEESSMVDALTGLKNRRYLGMSLPEEESRVLRAFRTIQASGRQPQGEDLILLLVDLDHFKLVNDTHGHVVGDAVLKLAAAAIRVATRDTDTVARWGGEEFLIVARRADRHSADVIARKILDEVRAHAYPVEGGELRLTCSVGFSAFPIVPSEPGAFGWEEVVEIADQCLYAAKRSGRDAFVGVYLEGPEAPPGIAHRLLSELPELVAEGQVTMKTSFEDGRALDWKRGH